MFLVGLTGGIGSGKSTVAERFAARGVEVIDADQIAREVVAPDGPALPGLVERFGEAILHPDGTLDRPTLAAVAFADDEARADLDRLTHPHIAARIASRIAELGARADARADDIIVVDHPLLIETGQVRRFDRVVAVIASEQLRIERLATSRGMDPDDVRARMRAQVDDASRREIADHVIVNDGDLTELDRQVDEIYTAIVAAAQAAG